MPDIWNTSFGFRNDTPVRPTPYLGTLGSVPKSPSAPTGTTSNEQMLDAIKGLLTPGLVPDIARQSAEVAAGRGIPGSPAGGSTAVRMSEQDYLERLGLANTLLSGEAGRTLPYQITPYQNLALQTQRDIANLHYGGLGGGGGGYPSGGGGVPRGTAAPFDLGGLQNYGALDSGAGISSGPAALGRTPMTLDDAYDWLGFGDFGSQSGDWTNPPQSEAEFMDFLGE